MLNWLDAQRFVLGDLTFQTLPPGLFTDGSGISMKGADFLIAKSRRMVDWYVALIERLRPRHVVELGVYQGGSTALFMELARPRRLVAIDRRRIERGPLSDHISQRSLDSVVRVHGGVDQADRPRLAGIVSEAFKRDALDLIVDDCSHKYAQTRASFNELFPRLRPGGIYVIEDWAWAHTSLDIEPLEGAWPDQVPLTRLLFELVLATPSVPGLIAELTVDHEWMVVERGDATIEPHDFDISACSNPRGRRMLAKS